MFIISYAISDVKCNDLFPLIYDSNGQCNIIHGKSQQNNHRKQNKKKHFCTAESAQKHFKIIQNYYTDEPALYGFQVHSVLSSFHFTKL